MMSAQMLSGAIQKTGPVAESIQQDDMKMLEAKAAAASADKENQPKETLGGGSNIMFVRGETQSKAVLESLKNQTASNPDEIDIDDDDDDEDDEEEEDEEKEGETSRSFGGVEKQAVPSEVFGGLQKDD